MKVGGTNVHDLTSHRFNSTKFSLVPGSPAGGALDATAPKIGADGKLTLTYVSRDISVGVLCRT